MKELVSKIDKLYPEIDGVCTDSSSEGYWSNLNEEEQKNLLSVLDTKTCADSIREKFPHLEEIIFDPTRAAGLMLLDIKEDETGVDYGCMWGNLLVYAAKNCRAMVGIDQTRDSLKFLQHRLKEEGLDNCTLINCNMRKNIEMAGTFDFAILNGVLEWIPEDRKIELKEFFKRGNFRLKMPERDPRTVQLEFLKMVFRNLKNGGRVYLGIENRHDYQYFLWKKDQHSNLMYTAVLPRSVANIISNIWYGRPYVTYTYSQNGLEELVKEAGFANIKMYAAFPDYKFPMKIIPLNENMESSFEPFYKSGNRWEKNLLKILAKEIRKPLDRFIYRKLKLFELCPSFIVIAEKK